MEKVNYESIKCMILQKVGQTLLTRKWGFTLVNQNLENGQ